MQGGFYPVQGGWPNMMMPMNMQQGYGGGQGGSGGGYSGGGGQSAGQIGGGGLGGGVVPKKKHPCDNCGSMDHWKYQPVCPNFHIHLAQQQAKHASMRGGQQQMAVGTAPKTEDGTVAVIPRQGESKVKLGYMQSSISLQQSVTDYRLFSHKDKS